MPNGRVREGERLATQRIGPATPIRVVDAILTGVYEAGTSHYELLRAFADDATLNRVETELAMHGYRTHEFGDSVHVERQKVRRFVPAAIPPPGHRTAGSVL
jgi:S-adenosylmethionine:tRNA ribosyltransferase-isomerase